MALYTALDFEGPFLKQLLEHFRKQQKAGEGVDLHLIADNPEDKMSLHQVMVLPRSKLISDLANSSSMPITLHIPETSLDSLNLLIQLLYGVAVEISEDVLPQLRSICKALGLSDWLENDVQKDKPAVEIEEFKEEPVRDDVSKESECPPEPLDAIVSSVARRSHRVQTLKCELCHDTCYSLASLQRHYNKCHFASASGKRVKDGEIFVKTTPGNTRLGEESEERDCLVNNDSGLGEENPPEEDILAASGPKLMFSLQQGPSYELSSEGLEEAFFQFGLLASCSCVPARTGYSGHLVFEDLAAAMAANYQLVQVGECEVYTSPHWNNLTARAVPHQVLLVCRRLPPMYERDMLVRKQFEEFGAVEAVEWWSVRGRKSSRLVISFKDKGVALDLIGSIQVVFGEKVKVREVSAFTMID